MASLMLLAVRVGLLPAATGSGLAVNEPICGSDGRSRPRAKAKPVGPFVVITARVPAVTTSPSGWRATATP